MKTSINDGLHHRVLEITCDPFARRRKLRGCTTRSGRSWLTRSESDNRPDTEVELLHQFTIENHQTAA